MIIKDDEDVLRIVKNSIVQRCQKRNIKAQDELVGALGLVVLKFQKFSNASLNAAVEAWCEYSGKAEAKFGHINDWDTSKVTSMEELFSADTIVNMVKVLKKQQNI